MEFEKNFKWCFTCDKAYLECAECGNNSCNAGCGQSIEGKQKPHWCDISSYNEFLDDIKDYPSMPTKDQVQEELDKYNKRLIDIDVFLIGYERYKKR